MDKIVNDLPIHGSGKEKTAFKLENDNRILISWNDENLHIPEFAKSAYYLQKIFHILRPDNFIDVHFADADGVVVDKIPESPDFAKAVAIQNRTYVPAEYDLQNDEWMRHKKAEILNNVEFNDACSLIQKLLIPNESDWGANELAEPINSTMVDLHPKIVELFNPVRKSWPNLILNSLNEDELTNTVAIEKERGTLSEKNATLIEKFLARYKANTNALRDIFQGKNSVPLHNDHETLAQISEELLDTTAPW